MIERKIIKSKLNQVMVEEYISNVLNKPGYSHTEMKRTPLGEKLVIHTSKPGLIVGRKGAAIKETAEELKQRFGLENPQIEVSEVENLNLNPNAVSKQIVHSFERFGPRRFKFLGYKILQNIIDAGAIGAEIVISGRGVPAKRSKTWRFTAGHLKKSGDISESHTKRAHSVAKLKSGAVGVKVMILTPDVVLPDTIKHKKDFEVTVEEITETVVEEPKKEAKTEEKIPTADELKEKQTTKKKIAKKKVAKKVAKKKVEENGDNKEN